jgi:hypothetical protein
VLIADLTRAGVADPDHEVPLLHVCGQLHELRVLTAPYAGLDGVSKAVEQDGPKGADRCLPRLRADLGPDGHVVGLSQRTNEGEDAGDLLAQEPGPVEHL